MDPRWYACYTRGRHEKRVAALLHQHGIETYLPLHDRTEQWKDRKKVVQWPLFPSYLFVHHPPRMLSQVLAVYGVVAMVSVGSTPVPIPDEEIENVRRFTSALRAHGLAPEREPLMEVGERVRITAGPMRGIVGVVIQRRGRARMLIGLHAMGQGFSVELDPGSLASLDRLGAGPTAREQHCVR